jgi:hypothetical protein
MHDDPPSPKLLRGKHAQLAQLVTTRLRDLIAEMHSTLGRDHRSRLQKPFTYHFSLITLAVRVVAPQSGAAAVWEQFAV